MKLRFFRICSLIIFAIICLFGIVLAIKNVFLSVNGLLEEDSYIILLIALLIGALLTGYETLFIGKSFKNGTTVLHALCMKPGTQIRQTSMLIVSSIASFVFLGLIVVNILGFNGIIKMNASSMACDFNTFYCIIIFANSLEILFYWLFIAEDDVEAITH